MLKVSIFEGLAL